MQVTNVKIDKRPPGSSLLAFANIEFDGVFTSKGWKIFKGREGRKYDMGFPQEIDRNGKKDAEGNPKWWNTIFIDLKTQSGRELMDQIREAAFAGYTSGGGKPPIQKRQEGGEFSDGAPF